MKYAAFLFLVGVVSGAPLIDEPLAQVTLTDGRQLHAVTAKTFGASSVGVIHADGRETLRYDLFPAPYRSQLEAHKPAPTAYVAPAPQPKAPAPARKRLDESQVYHDCLLDSVSINGTTATVTLSNTSNKIQSIWPFNLAAVSDEGDIAKGVDWVGLRSDSTVGVILKSQQFIPANDSVSLSIAFHRFKKGNSIREVVWLK